LTRGLHWSSGDEVDDLDLAALEPADHDAVARIVTVPRAVLDREGPGGRRSRPRGTATASTAR
jgi:hypothetical protein